jgi:glucoamylase
LVGRYLNDVYNGGNPQQPPHGNPWILCTAALAEFFYRAGIEHSSQGSISFSKMNSEFFTQAMSLASFRSIDGAWELQPLARAVQSNQIITAASQHFATAIRVLLAAGDSILLRIKCSSPRSLLFARTRNSSCITRTVRALILSRYHVAPQDVHMTEQINKDSGSPQGARDLTWSYGTVLGAMGSRKTLVSMIETQLRDLQSN